MKIGYRGYDMSGKAVHGAIEAADSREVGETLRKQGVFVTETFAGEHQADHATNTRSSMLDVGSQSRTEQVSDLFRQLSLLIVTGTPVVEALQSLERQVKAGPWQSTIRAVRGRVEEGKGLAEAMAEHPRYFDAVCISLIAAGEQGGKLDELSARLSRMLRQQVKVRKAVRGAMVYPCLLLCVALVVVCAMVGFVLPRFEGLFQTMDAKLPPATEVLMNVSHLLREHWPYVVGGVPAMLAGAYVWLRTPAGRRMIDVALVRTPKVGPIVRRICASRVARVLGTLLDGRVPMVEALALAKRAVHNSLYQSLIARAEESVLRGETLASALGDPHLMTPTLAEAIRSGERAGRLAPVLSSVADHLDEDNDIALRTLTSIMEPVILIVLGLVVGSMAVGMLLPLFDLTAATGAQGGAP